MIAQDLPAHARVLRVIHFDDPALLAARIEKAAGLHAINAIKIAIRLIRRMRQRHRAFFFLAV